MALVCPKLFGGSLLYLKSMQTLCINHLLLHSKAFQIPWLKTIPIYFSQTIEVVLLMVLSGLTQEATINRRLGWAGKFKLLLLTLSEPITPLC